MSKLRNFYTRWSCRLGIHGWAYTFVQTNYGWGAATRACRRCKRVEHFEADVGAMGDQGDWVEGLR